MALVTFMSDFGTEDHYVAAVKAVAHKMGPQTHIIDISHEIYPSDIGHASYVLKSVFRDFPTGTVHLCAIDMNSREPSKLVAVQLEEHYFVGYDSGLFSLLSDQAPTAMVELSTNDLNGSTFLAKDLLAPAAVALANGKKISELGRPLDVLKTLYARQLKVTKREIAGNIIRVDHYGNLITNIVHSAFETIMKLNGEKPYEVCFGRERSRKIHSAYHEVESGEYFILFNSNQQLQIGINKGNASELLGLHLDAPVIINFQL